MKLSFISKIAPKLPLGILILSLLVIYLRTLAPGLTWANDGSDGGDFITAAFTGGVPHPTGYPLYLLLARLFQFLPIGSLAYRTNIMSAVTMALAAAVVYKIVTRFLTRLGNSHAWLAGLVAGFSFGLAPLVWSQAVITEVYALQAFLIALVFYLYAETNPIPGLNGKKLDRWRGLVLGLAMGNHITTLLLAPVALLLGSVHYRLNVAYGPDDKDGWLEKLRFDPISLRRQLIWLGAGLSLYLILPLRALSHPPINWGNVVTPARLWWLVSGGVYKSYYLQSSLPEIWGRMQAGSSLLLQQFGFLGVVLGLVGLIVFGVLSRLYILTIWTASSNIVFAILYGSNDSYVYLIPMFLSFAIWIGLGLAGLIRGFVYRSTAFRLFFATLVICYFTVRFLSLMNLVDASHDYRAEAFGREFLTTAPANAIVFAKGDPAVFSLWYFHFALGERPDLAIVAADLLHFDWYQENLHSIYPLLVVPGPFPWPETIAKANPTRVVCYVQYTDQTEVECNDGLNLP